MTRELVAGGEDGMHRLRRVLRLDAEEEKVELGVEGDPEVRVQHLEMWERIRVAAGQTS
jgi:hypothetical protein